MCRLGGFRTMMSFMGSIGSMMKGSGLEEALETAYGPNPVIHMISGKAVSRALRGHFLVEAALVNKLMMAVLPCEQNGNVHLNLNEESRETLESVSENSQASSRDMHDVEMETALPSGEMETGSDLDIVDKLNATDVERIHDLYEGIKDKSIPADNIVKSKELMKLNECIFKYKALLAERSPTTKLWMKYIEYVETLKLFIRAERTGNWSLHLVAVRDMMNLLTATCHVNYAKSSRLYLQLMLELPTDHPWLHHCFIELGFHTVRRSSRYSAGLWTDLTIEQVMMRSIKSRGGLTRGQGVTESVCLQWYLQYAQVCWDS